MSIQTLHDVLEHELQDLYSAEQQILRALPKMAEAATSEKLKAGLEKHLLQTQGQVTRLEEAASLLEIEIEGEKCKGMEGLLAEGAKLLKEDPSFALDAALISAAQRVEHYEIAGYGTAKALAKFMKQPKVAKLLDETLTEEAGTDEKLTKIAESEVMKKEEQE